MRNSRKPVRRLSLVAFVGMAVGACGSTTTAGTSSAPDPLAVAHLQTVDTLAAGELGSLPTGPQFIRISAFHQSPHQTSVSKKHQVGALFVRTGTQILTYVGMPPITIDQGTAVFLSIVQHSHSNPGPIDNVWYFIALWKYPSDLVAGSTDAYSSLPIPTNALAPGSYTETLRKLNLAAGGRSPAHRFGGLEVIYVLDGTLTVKVSGQLPQQLAASDGATVLPNTLTQEVAAGSAGADYLAFFVTPNGVPFETAASVEPTS